MEPTSNWHAYPRFNFKAFDHAVIYLHSDDWIHKANDIILFDEFPKQTNTYLLGLFEHTREIGINSIDFDRVEHQN